MKSIFAFIGLVAFLGISVMVHMNLKETKNEQTIIGWSNSLIWSALRTSTVPNFLSPELDKADSNGHWQVAGDIRYRDRAGALVQQSYRAIVAQSCPLRERRECWTLAALEVGGEAVDLQLPEQDTVEASEQDREYDSPGLSGPNGGDTAGEEISGEPDQTAIAETPTLDQALGLPDAIGLSDQSASVEPPVPEEAQSTDSIPVVTETPVAVEIIDQRALVLRIQKRLDALGFDPGVPDGQFEPRTEAAIRAYQASRGLAGEGAPSIQLLQQLESR